MKLGAFSVSLSVKNLETSREFYQKLGFAVFAGSLDKKYLIMKNEATLIGLFEGMFQGNMLTFNPGWNQNAETLEDFEDVRSIQNKLKKDGVSFSKEITDTKTGPGSFVITDPDGNVILVDQHVS